ncbi:MAG: AraC family transcriptional regulator [Defluviitaleaceae bacterium]|nr:AraC family transcriptional regulator [Defluviitaleaceae bacterium]
MDWFERMNSAMDYIEDNLTGNIELEKAAKLACCSEYHFQRIFTLITNLPVMEYVRRRRMSLAAVDLQQSKSKVVDISLKYGYESHSAFTRAFNSIHGVSPISARGKGVILKSYPRIHFHLSVKGDIAMDYKIERKKAFSIFGKSKKFRHDVVYAQIPEFWNASTTDGTAERILTEAGKKLPSIYGPDIYGSDDMLLFAANLGHDEYGMGYMICQIKPDSDLSHDFEIIDIPELDWIVFTTKPVTIETATDAVQDLWKRLGAEWFSQNPEFEYANAPSMELYYHAGKGLFKAEVAVPLVRK